MPNLFRESTATAGLGTNVGVGYPPNASWSDENGVTGVGDPAFIGFFEGGQNGDALHISGFDFNLPDNAEIDGISVTITGSNLGCYGNLYLGSGSEDVGTLNKTYGGASELWGYAWTPADINNDPTVVIELADVSGGDGIASISLAEMTVYWHYNVDVDPADVPHRYDYKFFDKDETYLGNLPNVASPFGYDQDINSVGSQLEISVATSPDYADIPSLALGSLAGWLEGWDYRTKMTITRDKVTESLTDFPIYVDLSHLPLHFWTNIDSAGADLRITDGYGQNELPFELREIDTGTKTGILWFKGNLSAFEHNYFYFYYGNDTATAYDPDDPLGSKAVWTQFSSVWHLNESDSPEREFQGIDTGVSSDTNLAYTIDTFNAVANLGELYVTGSILKDKDGTSRTLGNLRHGVTLQMAVGASNYGFIMHSVVAVRTRFSASTWNANHADNLVGVRWNTSSGIWQYDDNNGTWTTFTPASDDLLIARYDSETEDMTYCYPIYGSIRDSKQDRYASTAGAVTENDAVIGKGIEFDGSSDRYFHGIYDYPSTSNLTYLLWAKPDTTIAAETQANTGTGATGGGRWAIYPEQGATSYGATTHVGVGLSIGTNGIVAGEHTSSHAPTIAVYNGSIPDDEWSRVALRVTSKQYKIYVNGTLVHTGLTSTKTFLHAGDSIAGGAVSFGLFDGELDEVFIAGTQSLSEAWVAADYANQNDPASFYSFSDEFESEEDYTDVLIKNGNLVEVWETSYYYPNGKRMYKGQINNVEAEFNPSASGIIKMKLHSEGRGMDNILARGAPFTYTDDVTQTSNTTYFTVTQDSKSGGWNRCGQLWTAGASNLGRIKLRLYGNATVTVSVYDGVHGNFLGEVSKAVNTGGSISVVEFLLDFIDTTSGADYFFTVSVNAGKSIRVYYANNTNPYANGSMYTSSYSGGSGGGLYGISTNDDLYFITASGTPSTQAAYTSDDPTADMLTAILDDYNDQGGIITYDPANIDATGLTLSYTFNVATIYEAVQKILELSPNGFYFYVDLGESSLYFKEASQTPDITLIKGRHIESLKLRFSIENVVNKVMFSGAETAGVNLYSEYNNADSRSLYGTRIERKSDNRVTVLATADRIGNNLLAERKDEQYQTEVTILAKTMDLTLLKPGMTVSFRGYGNFIDHLILQIVRIAYKGDRATLTLGTIPLRFNTAIEQTIRGLIAQQTVNNPATPS